jgi:hypothetical protein
VQTHLEGCSQEDQHGRSSILTRLKMWEGNLLAEVGKIPWCVYDSLKKKL